MTTSRTIVQRVQARYAGWQNQRRIQRLARQAAESAPEASSQPPVLLFNASARIQGLSQNAAFQLLTAWSLRLAGQRVVQFVCHGGMSPCVLGTNRQDFSAPPPCEPCMAQSGRMYAGAEVHPFTYQPDVVLAAALESLSVDEMCKFEWEMDGAILPLGRLCLPSIRWALRRHTLPDSAENRSLMRQYLLSAQNVARAFAAELRAVQPRAALIFNGSMYPEATARWVAQQHGTPVITHEVGFQRLSTFMTTGQATAYPMAIPDDFELDAEMNAALDAYLEKRFQGKFSMAGITFWPEMRGLDEAFLQRAAGFRQIVPVFTNVVYDTSQVHANLVFEHMFAWLDQALEIMRAHPDTLFVIRAHPDEMRPGTAKQSNESVRAWVERNGVDALPNVAFIDSQEYISSYELIQRAKFLMVYNSSIGLEAALLGKGVLTAGKARYTQYPMVFFPETVEAHRRQAEAFLDDPEEQIAIPGAFRRNARRFMYYQLYCASLPFDAYLEPAARAGFVQLKDFAIQDLLPERSATMQVIHAGLLHGRPFVR